MAGHWVTYRAVAAWFQNLLQQPVSSCSDSAAEVSCLAALEVDSAHLLHDCLIQQVGLTHSMTTSPAFQLGHGRTTASMPAFRAVDPGRSHHHQQHQQQHELGQDCRMRLQHSRKVQYRTLRERDVNEQLFVCV